MDIFQETLNSLQTEDRVMLATIISTTGSTPASAFSKMLVKNQGTVSVGTVGGGCLEGDVLQIAKRLYDSGKTEIATFHLNEDEFVQGLICGGSLDIIVEPVTQRDAAFFQQLQSLRDEGEDCIFARLLTASGDIVRKVVVNPNSTKDIDKLASSITNPQSDIAKEIYKAHHRYETRRVKTAEGVLILEPLAGSPSLVLFGGGHVSKYISRAATMAGFRTTVVDDRKEYANPQRFPEATRTLTVDFAEAFSRLTIKPSTYIVIVTRGHRYDEEILERALTTLAKYIGMIGSKRKVLTTYEHMVERGVPVESLQRVHAPMGLEIGAATPEEIGISVVAQLIAVRRGEADTPKHKSDVMKGLIRKLKLKESVVR